MLPLRDVIPSRTAPLVTIALACLNGAAWLSTWAPGAWANRTPVLATGVLHANWLHAVAAIWALWIFGENVEGRLGRTRFLLFYLLCAAAAIGGCALAGTPLPAPGASGPVAGVAGGYLVLYPRSRVLALVPVPRFWDLVEVPAALLAAVWAALMLTAGGAPVAPLAAGLAAGATTAVAFRKPRWEPAW